MAERHQSGVGGRDDLSQFARMMRHASATHETRSPTEQRVSWQLLDRSGFTQTVNLESTMSLMTARVRWDEAWSFAIPQTPSALKFIMLRGDGPRLSTGDGGDLHLAGGTFHVSRLTSPSEFHFQFDARAATSQHDELALEIDPARLCELLGSTSLPTAISTVMGRVGRYSSLEFPMSAGLSRLFDEIAHHDGRPRTRQLYLHAKTLELLAALIDELDEEASAHRLSRDDVERLERARRLLVERLEVLPTLAELSRSVGINQTKLKVGFRTLFGHPVHAYLRRARMEEAERLLTLRRYTVSEVAQRVGYSNPSKFAAAFRRHFGVPPRAR